MTTKQPKPGQVWDGRRGMREEVVKDWTYSQIVWRRPGKKETHRTSFNQWRRWSDAATLVSEGDDDDADNAKRD